MKSVTLCELLANNKELESVKRLKDNIEKNLQVTWEEGQYNPQYCNIPPNARGKIIALITKSFINERQRLQDKIMIEIVNENIEEIV